MKSASGNGFETAAPPAMTTGSPSPRSRAPQGYAAEVEDLEYVGAEQLVGHVEADEVKLAQAGVQVSSV